MKIKKIISDALENYESRAFVITNDVLAFFTIASVLGIVLESIESLAPYTYIFNWIEYASVIVFSIEYIARLIITRPVRSYVFGFYGIIDLLSILPTYFGLANLTFLKTVRMLRILRFLRVIRLTKFVRSTTRKVKESEKHSHLYQINVEIYFMALFFAVIFFGSLIYLAEGHQAYAQNIPMGMIWAAKLLLGVDPPAVDSIAGELIIISTRFVSYVLFGLLIHVVGNSVSRFLFGSDDLEKAS